MVKLLKKLHKQLSKIQILLIFLLFYLTIVPVMVFLKKVLFKSSYKRGEWGEWSYKNDELDELRKQY